MGSENRQLMARKLILTIFAVIITLVSVASITSAQESQTSGSRYGTIASLQNCKNGKPEWILSGGWELNINSSTSFHAAFNMIRSNGNASYRQSITDVNITNTTKNGTEAMYSGTATVSLKPFKPKLTDVPISITLIGSNAAKLWIGIPPVKGDRTGYLLNTTIYGVQIPPYL
jgi:hypothetical protein